MDPGFVNDSTIYYNLPSTLAVKNSPRRSTLPRPHSSFICERFSSCPTSPKLSIFKPKCSLPQPPLISQNNKRVGDVAPEADDSDNGLKDGIPRNGKEKSVSELPETKPLYQNARIGIAKPRRKPIFFPWWKRKRSEPGIEGETGSLSGVEVTEKDGTPVLPPEAEKILLHRNSTESLPLPSNYLELPTRSSSCSSSTTLNEDDEGGFLGERVMGGVSYVKPSKTCSSRRLEAFRRRVSKTSELAIALTGVDFSQRIGHWVHEWRRKSRWLSRRRREKNPRHNGEGDVDIALIHYSKDTAMWVDYLHDSFSCLLQDTLRNSQVRIEKINIQSFSGYHEIPEVQASRLKDAKLQIVILSPGLLAFLNSESEFQIGKLLRPKRVLALLLGVTQQAVKGNSVALSALYSFEEWAWLQVRDRDESFVAEVQEQSLRLLTHCDVFDQCKVSSAFSVCPRKITQSYCKVYIHLKSPLNSPHERQIHVTVGQSSSFLTVPIPQVQCHNPFTLSFDMPEKLLGVSSFLKVNLHVDGLFIGSREVKCEGPLEILKDLLKSAVDPTDLMCQALGICPVSNDLDEILAERVKGKLPLLRDFNNEHKPNCISASHELPTWVHFGAFYGLQNFTWALLDIPAGEIALLIRNSKGNTPAKLALQEGYSKLAQDLENVSIVTALARKTSVTKDLERPDDDPCTEEYSPVPRPRPCTPRTCSDIPSYDTPPQPRSVKGVQTNSPFTSREKISESTSLSFSDTSYANLLHNSSPISDTVEVDSPKLSASLVDWIEKGQEYLDMSGRSLQFEEYQKDITILVDAWDNRNDARTFLSKYQHTISKLKNFYFKTQNSEECLTPSPTQINAEGFHEGNNNETSSDTEND